jgi:tripartite motif-containing protein 71
MDLNPSKKSILNLNSRRVIFIAVVALVLLSTEAIFPDGLGLEESYKFLTKWGSTGTGDGEFRHPHNIDVDSSGNLYVTERDNMRVQKFTSDGTFIAKWESNVTGVGGTPDLMIKEKDVRPIFRSNITRNGEFLDPHGIDVNSLGNVYVVDTRLNIQMFDSNGKFLTKWGTNGTGNGQFRHPHGIIHDSFDNVYVTDYINSNVQKFDSNGKFLTKWGTNGTGNGQFYKLECIDIDTDGNIYVVDGGNNRIQKFDSNGKFLTKWGANGTGTGEFRHPYGIAVDTLDNVFVSDLDNSQVKKFSNDGKFITKWGTNGTGNGEFKSPEGIAVDLKGNVYVTDPGNDRVQKFSPRPQ